MFCVSESLLYCAYRMSESLLYYVCRMSEMCSVCILKRVRPECESTTHMHSRVQGVGKSDIFYSMVSCVQCCSVLQCVAVCCSVLQMYSTPWCPVYILTPYTPA